MRATLTFHSIDDSGSPVSVSPAAFAETLAFLASGRVAALPLDDLVAGGPGASDAVAVTFDDGFETSGAAIAQLLDRGIVPTVFVVTGRAGRTNAWGGRDAPGIPTLPLLSWDALERLLRRGARIEAHTRTHPPLTRVPAARLADELEGSRADLERRLGVTSRHIAYPYGDVDDHVAAEAARAFAAGHTTEMASLSGNDEPLRLPRLDMYYFQSPGAFDAWGTPAFARRLAGLRRRRRLRQAATGWFRRPPVPESAG